jgi:NAD(P)-dependent dehydrogenase (short-subunit alcohol dehydrogenase family)
MKKIQKSEMRVSSFLSVRLLVAFLHIVICFSFDTNNGPKPAVDKSKFSKPFVAVSALAGLYIGKRFIDGPVFTESVSLKGQNVLITGANSGLGKATAEKLASLGANTYLLCKTPAKGEATALEIQEKTGNKNVYSIPMDLRSLKSIANAAKEIHNRMDNIHILVNNAGVMALPQRTVTEDNFEGHLGINHLGHFAFTGQVFDLLKKQDPLIPNKRLVNVASAAHYFGHLDRDNLMLDRPGSYEPWPAYGNSKQANILFTVALNQRLQTWNQQQLQNQAPTLITTCCHPGVCRTDLGRYAFDLSQLPAYLNPVLGVVLSPASK